MGHTSQDRFLKENISREDLMDMFENALFLMSFVKCDPDIEDFVEECRADGFNIEPGKLQEEET